MTPLEKIPNGRSDDKFDLEVCTGCSGSHKNISFSKIIPPLEGRWRYAIVCPTTDAAILAADMVQDVSAETTDEQFVVKDHYTLQDEIDRLGDDTRDYGR